MIAPNIDTHVNIVAGPHAGESGVVVDRLIEMLDLRVLLDYGETVAVRSEHVETAR